MTAMDPRARVGDADREQAVADLQRYVAEGYLTLDEFSERSAAAYRATTQGELAAVTQDLTPGAAAHRDRHPDRTWSRPVVIAAAVVVGVVLAVGLLMAIMMLGMMGGMDMGGMR